VSYITEFSITDDQLLATDNRGGLHYGGLADSEGAHVVIPKVTFEAHKGNLYNVSYRSQPNVAVGGTLVLLLDTGANEPHVVFEATTGADAIVYFYENPSVSASGTLVETQAYNRTILNASTTRVYYNPTITASGTDIYRTNITGGGGGTSSLDFTSRLPSEWVLKPNSAYTLVLINAGVSTEQASIVLEWYEA
jgi:hypothetical protein